MASKVTIQDIADALGLSRNTVSKAINNTGVLADATRERILAKAVEMGYKQFSYASVAGAASISAPMAQGQKNEIAVFTTLFLNTSHFASTMLDKFQREAAQLGYSIALHRILPEDLQSRSLPKSMNPERTAGIVCFEVFDEPYARMVCECGIPVLFVDTPVCMDGRPLEADRLYMDNTVGITDFIGRMSARGKKKIGFIGEYTHCQSFFERFMAYRNAMFLCGLPIDESWCITGNLGEEEENVLGDRYRSYLYHTFRRMNELPDVFICANDFIAFDAMQVFKLLGIAVPKDVYLFGFDDSPESRLVTPTLSTVHIHSQIMGYSATQLLISRINEPSLNFRTVHTESTLILRESTED